MSLRGLVVLLLLANAGYAAWSQGWLDGVLGQRRTQREPERLSRQVDAESLRVLPPPGAGAADTPGARALAAPERAASAAPAASAALGAPVASAAAVVASAALAGSAPAFAARACLEAGPFRSEAEAAAAERSLAALPAASWVRVTDARAGRHAIVMGRFASDEALHRKEDELRRLRLPFETLASPPALAGALSLGRFEGREAAEAALASLAARGVKTARIEVLVPPGLSYRLRVPQADAALAAQLASLEAEARATLAGGFRPCESAVAR